MKQMTFGMVTGFEKHQKVTRRAQFLAEMNQVVPWSRLLALIEPYDPKVGNVRPPKGLEIMLRMLWCPNIRMNPGTNKKMN